MRFENIFNPSNRRSLDKVSGVNASTSTDNAPEHVTSKAGLLSKQEIQSFSLISECDKGCLQAGSYDLRVGDRHFVFEASGRWKAIFLGEPEELAEANRGLPSDPSLTLQLPLQGHNNLVIPPFGSAIIQLKETVDLLSVAKNNNLMVAGRFDLKLKAIYKGLISQQATQVEPCYKGKLYCFVHNLGAQEVDLKKDDTLATIEFSYVGQNLSENEREKIIRDTIEANKKKYGSGRFVEENTGIGDVRWLKSDRLPKECGIAPIYDLVRGNIEEEVEKQLEKSSTIDKLADRVGSRLSEKQNVLKIIFSLIAAVITYFTANFLIEVNAELKYFSQELSFLIERDSELEAPALERIYEHTQELTNMRSAMWTSSLILLAVIVGFMLIIFYLYLQPNEEQEWKLKLKALEAEHEYKTYRNKLAREAQEKKAQEKKAQEKSCND